MENKNKRELYIFLFVIIFGFCLSSCIYMYRSYMAHEAKVQIDETMSDAFSEHDSDLYEMNIEEIDLSQPEVFWNEKCYRRNAYVKAILCIGVDRNNSMDEYKELGEAGQADSIFLIAQDTARNQLKILMIPRDTMAEITVLNTDGSIKGKQMDHLLMAYAYGDGRESSCQNLVDSVSKLFHGLQIEYYISASTAVIRMLNDAVGGVTVTIPTVGMEMVDPEFIHGSTVKLNGDQAELFVRYRDIETDHSAIFRMNQQKEYMIQFYSALHLKSMEDNQIVTKLFSTIEEYMVTNMKKDQYLKIALDSIEANGISEDVFYTVPGTDVTTDTFDEFHVDEEKMLQVLLDMFYRET